MNQLNDQELKIYEITNRSSGERHFAASYSVEEACKQAGWDIGDCFIVHPPARSKATEKGETRTLVKVPCEICPYQYGECKKPDTEACPTRREAPELMEWTKQAALAHLCPFVGEVLTKKDYQNHQKWLPLSAAIEELEHHNLP
ncbi:hypothetical protein ES703_84095 [subsurface metagenome]